jgi:hypothetical protein
MKQYDRKTSTSKTIQFRNISSEQGQRKASSALNIPRGTLRYWSERRNEIDLPLEVVDFFESPVGVDFLHQIIVAAILCVNEIGSCGIRVLCLFLKLSQLDNFVASSLGVITKKVSEIEYEIIEFEKKEKSRLAAQMPHKRITVAEDETFHPHPCLVAIEPVSNFIILEQYSKNRKTDTWNELMDNALRELPVKVIQSTSDEGQAIVKHAEEHLLAHHSSDIFHVQYEISKATVAPMASKIYHSRKNLDKAKAELQKYQSKTPLSENDKLKTNSLISLIKMEEKKLLNATVNNRNIQIAKKELGNVYHPYNVETGTSKDKEQLNRELRQQITTIRTASVQADLSDASHSKIDKAERVFENMLATLTFYWKTVDEYVGMLPDVNPKLKTLLLNTLIPVNYLQYAAKKEDDKTKSKRIKKQAKTMKLKLESDDTWKKMTTSQKQNLTSTAEECAQLFQRSSSCVEGRNGYLSFRHHGLHDINERKLKTLTILHNYYIERPDGTTAAERFFGAKPKDLFQHLIDNIELLPRPAKKGVKRRKAEAVA